MVVPANRYIPVLTGKTGEFRALSKLSPDERAAIQPIIDVPPLPEDKDPAALLDGLLNGVGGAFQNNGAIAVDLLGLQGRTANGLHPIEYILERHEWCAAGVHLAVRTDAPGEYIDLIATHHSRSRGVCVRAMILEDRGADEMAQRVDWLLDTLKLAPDAVHLCLDCGNVKEWDRRPDDVVAWHLARDLSAFGLVSVAATSVPGGSQVMRDERPNRFPRREWRSWRRLREAGYDILFGDYGITGVRPTEPTNGLPDPRLRYTTDAALLIWRGRRAELVTEEDERKPTSFADLCRELMGYGVFAGEEFSDGDRAFAAIAAGTHRNKAGQTTEGGPSQWVQWATSHHLAHVVRDLEGADSD